MPAFSRLHKATAIAPLALLSAAWSVSLAGGATLASADEGVSRLPDGTKVPTQAIEAPASVSAPAGSTPAAASGDTRQIVATASTSGIPTAALAAYQRAEAVINSADKSCNISWQLIAAIGRVESDHGRYAGNRLDDEGVAQPGIYGVALNGKNNTQRIMDTDAGQYDSDTKFDRAVGPMQFIPSTWSVVGVDGDNDGKRNPQDIDDAALATAVYLCSGDDDLSSDKGQRASVFRYNRSNDYVDLVLSIMGAYLEGDYTSVPNGTTSAGIFNPNNTGPSIATARGNKARNGGGRSNAVVRGGGSSSSGTKSTTTTSAKSTPTATPAPVQTTQTAAPQPEPTKVTTKLPSTTTLPSTTLTPVDETLTLTEALAQCTAQGVIDDPLTSNNELTDCANALLAG